MFLNENIKYRPHLKSRSVFSKNVLSITFEIIKTKPRVEVNKIFFIEKFDFSENK